MIRGDVVTDLEREIRFNGICERICLREWFNVGSADNLQCFCLLGTGGEKNGRVINAERFGHGNLYFFSQRPRIGNVTGQCTCSRQFRRNQIDLRITRAAAPFKVSVECTQGYTTRIRRKAHADTRSACTFQNSCAGIDQIIERTAFGEHGKHLT